MALRDPALAEAAARRPWALSEVYRAVVAGDIAEERRVVLRRLERMGAL